MREPHFLFIPRRREALGEAYFGRVGVRVGQDGEGDGFVPRPREFSFQLFFAHFGRTGWVERLRPLNDVVVLNARYRASREVTFPAQSADVFDVSRCEVLRHFDDHPTGRKIHIKQILRARRPPVRGWGGGEYVRH